MKIYQYIFYLLVSFSLIIHNVTILPTLSGWMQPIFVVVTLSLGVIMAIIGFESMKQGFKENKK